MTNMLWQIFVCQGQDTLKLIGYLYLCALVMVKELLVQRTIMFQI